MKDNGKINDIKSDDIGHMLSNFENSNKIKFTTTTLSDVLITDLHHDNNNNNNKIGCVKRAISTTKDNSGKVHNSLIYGVDTLKEEQVRQNMTASQYLFISIVRINIPALCCSCFAQELFGVV